MLPTWLLLQQSQRKGVRHPKRTTPVLQHYHQSQRVCHHTSKRSLGDGKWKCLDKSCGVVVDNHNQPVVEGVPIVNRWGVDITEKMDMGFLREEFARQRAGFTAVQPPTIVRAVQQTQARTRQRIRAGDMPRGNLGLAEYQFWIGTQMEASLFARCRGCRKAVLGGYDQRKAHVEEFHCTTAIVVACKKMLGAGKCMYCRKQTTDRRWGLPMCSEPCARGWMFSDSAMYPEFAHEVEAEQARQKAYELQADAYQQQRGDAAVEGP